VPRVVQPFAAPASAAGWIEELRRAPVWIPTGDALVNPQPESDEGSSMELESVIDSFREQMARALDGDGAARYDLGVAYYEMGLYNEALAEFESAARCPGLEVQSFEMLAACLLQTGRHAEVVELLLPVLAADGHSPRGRLGLHYSLGLAYEALGDWQQAQRCFEEVALVDVDFKDVQTRLRRT
jgi:tetratricopeptide (TPR) repeat protein